uniref:Transcription factor CBF/NF-Y/archaeal histone domain-containing protein n=1 Tax=Panagrolaimus sp. PS1159 TaxID=55785 RepID=A0AC35FHY6_9BILA
MSSEAVDSPILFDDSAPVNENVEIAVADVTDEIETIEIDDSAVAGDSVTKKKSSKSNIPTVLPLSKVKKICKLDPAVNLITADAVKLITFCTERFIELLAKSCVSCAKEQGRKTVNNADFQRAIRRSWLFYMLDEALDEWPDANTTTTKRSKSAASNNDGDEPEDTPNGDEEEEDIADTDDIIQDEEVIEIDVNEIVEVERALTPLLEEEEAMEEDVEEEEPIIVPPTVEEEEESSEDSDIENQEEDTTAIDNDDIYVKDIEDL